MFEIQGGCLMRTVRGGRVSARVRIGSLCVGLFHAQANLHARSPLYFLHPLLSYIPSLYTHMTSRAPFIRQDGYFTTHELTWLRAAYERPEVQNELRRPRKEAPVKQAANCLTILFREEISGPGPAETDQEFKQRVSRARKADRGALFRKEESVEAFTERMKQLPDVSAVLISLSMRRTSYSI